MAKKKEIKSVQEDTFDYDKPRDKVELYLAKAIGESVTLPLTDTERKLVYLRKLIDVIEQGGGGTEVIANPTLVGTESDLTGLQVGDTKYKVPTPINVVANPTLAGNEDALSGLQVGDTKYQLPHLYEHNIVMYCRLANDNMSTGYFVTSIYDIDVTEFTFDTLTAYIKLRYPYDSTTFPYGPCLIANGSAYYSGSTLFVEGLTVNTNEALAFRGHLSTSQSQVSATLTSALIFHDYVTQIF